MKLIALCLLIAGALCAVTAGFMVAVPLGLAALAAALIYAGVDLGRGR